MFDCELIAPVHLILIIEELACHHEFLQDPIWLQKTLEVRIMSNSLQHIEKGRTCHERLETHVHITVDLLLVSEAFIWLRELCHGKLNLIGKFKLHIILDADWLCPLHYNYFSFSKALLLVVFLEHVTEI